jgi:hypothetical protein
MDTPPYVSVGCAAGMVPLSAGLQSLFRVCTECSRRAAGSPPLADADVRVASPGIAPT